MIDFDLTDEQQFLEQSVREWAARDVAPRIHHLDREHHFDSSSLAGMASPDLLGLSAGEARGRAGMDSIAVDYRNSNGAVIYQGTREIYNLMQADGLVGYRADRPARCALPPYRGGDT